MQRPSEKRGVGGYLSAIPRAKHKISMGFWFRKSKVNSEKGTLYIYVIVDEKKRNDAECSTHVKVLRQDWDSKNQRVLESDPLHEEKNEELTYIRKLFLKLKERAEEEQGEITSKNLVESFISIKRSVRVDLSILTHYKRFLVAQKARNDIKERSLNIYEHTFAKLEGFLRSINRPNLEVHNFTIPKADQFKTYLLQTCKLSAEPAVKVLTIVKKFLAFCVSMEVIRHSPLEHYTLQRPKPATPKVLNLDELVVLEDTVLPKRLRKVADFFLMQCYTGLSYTDLVRVIECPESFICQADGEGKEWIELNRQKTGILTQVPIIPQAKILLVKYGGWGNIPYISNGKTNEYLKEVALCCEIVKNLHTHLARKTFIATILNRAKTYFPNAQSNSVKPLVLMKMAGWNSLRELNRYAQMERETIREELGF